MERIQRKNRSRRASIKADGEFAINYRCPRRLIGPLNEARFALRERSRMALMTKAIEAYLAAKGIEIPSA